MAFLITKAEAEKILNYKDGKLLISLDLNLTNREIIKLNKILIIDNYKIPLGSFENLKENFVYLIEDNKLRKIEIFSPETNLYYKLLPTKDWPTFTLSSTPMHRHTHLSPKEDTMLKIKEIAPVSGNVLDTCCGLGYTAIMAAKTADMVYTFERDENVIYLAKLNSYSQDVFTNKKIELFFEDVCLGIKKFQSESFDRIIHDPPTLKRAPELFSRVFQSELYRVLKKEGIIYHYTPLPGKTKGKKFYKSIVRNLKEIGFRRVEFHGKSLGVRAVK